MGGKAGLDISIFMLKIIKINCWAGFKPAQTFLVWVLISKSISTRVIGWTNSSSSNGTKKYLDISIPLD